VVRHQSAVPVDDRELPQVGGADRPVGDRQRVLAPGAVVDDGERLGGQRPPDTTSGRTSKEIAGAAATVARVIFTQFVDDDLGCASYLVGDEDEGIAVVVDPPYAIEPVLAEAERRGVRLTAVLETHTHADHVSGHGRLALDHGLPVHVHPAAEVDYPNTPLEDGAEV